MSILDFTRIALYRIHEKGFEVFLINSDMKSDPNIWHLPQASNIELQAKFDAGEIIEIELEGQAGEGGKLLAIEGDWHHIPSIRGMIKHDVKVVKTLVKESIPGIDKGAFVAIKESMKKLMPDEYKALKELKDIIIDRNTVRNI